MRLNWASKLLVIVLTLLVWASWPAARGDSFDDAGVLLAGKYPEIEQGVALLAASGDPAAAAALQALGAGQLLIGPDKALFIERDDGTLVAARDGAQVEGDRPPGLKPVKVNNRIRRAIETAMGQLTLLSSSDAVCGPFTSGNWKPSGTPFTKSFSSLVYRRPPRSSNASVGLKMTEPNTAQAVLVWLPRRYCT